MFSKNKQNGCRQSSREPVRGGMLRAAAAPVLETLETRRLLATFNVTTTTDEVSSNGQMSLREAIIAANAVPSAESVTINLQADAIYTLLRSRYMPGGGDSENNPTNDPLYGDLDIRRSMTINGNNASIRAGSISDRVLDIRANASASVVLKDMTLRDGGNQSLGGGIYAMGGTSLTLNNVRVDGNETVTSSGARGGGLYMELGDDSYLFIIDSEFYDNTVRANTYSSSSDGTAYGGGVFTTGPGTVGISNSTFTQNSARADNVNPNDEYRGGYAYGGGLATLNADVVGIFNSTFDANSAVAAWAAGDGPAGRPMAARFTSARRKRRSSPARPSRTTTPWRGHRTG